MNLIYGTGAPRLFDLVKVRDAALAVAFYFAMRDTVVAAELEQAARIAYGPDKRWSKVVTLKVSSKEAFKLVSMLESYIQLWH